MIRGVLLATGALLLIPLLAASLGIAIIEAAAGATGGGVAPYPSSAATSDIPSGYLNLYLAASRDCPGLDWTILAAIGKVETDHGRSTLPGVANGENGAGAGGPMQFLAATFATTIARHPPPPGGAVPPSRYNPHDAIHTAAAYLCDSGAPEHLDVAVRAYNNSDTYVAHVQTEAARYRSTIPPGPGAGGSVAARIALDYARGQIGLPYLWGGNGPEHGDPGFDCSGLTTAAYAAAGITLPRTAHTQYLAGPSLPTGTHLAPGDLLFFGTPAHVHHVGIATGDGTLMINAPQRGTLVRIQNATDFPDYFAASRPTQGASG